MTRTSPNWSIVLEMDIFVKGSPAFSYYVLLSIHIMNKMSFWRHTEKEPRSMLLLTMLLFLKQEAKK